MDLDAFVEANRDSWQRMETLVGKHRLSPTESVELFDLYQRTSTHLSIVRSSLPDPTLVAGLSRLLIRARVIMGTGTTGWTRLSRVFTHWGPMMLYRTRYWWLITWLTFHVLTAALTIWFVTNPRILETVMAPKMIEKFVQNDFSAYYSTYPAQDFAFQVWSNNALLSALVIALGVTGAMVIYLLWVNALNVAIAGALMITNDAGEVFFGLILPHGLLELLAVCVSAGVGLQIFWSWIVPGPHTRSESLAKSLRENLNVIAVITVTLLAAGIIEAFITPSHLPTWIRISIGVASFAAFLIYALNLGRKRWLQWQTASAEEKELYEADTRMRPSEIIGLAE